MPANVPTSAEAIRWPENFRRLIDGAHRLHDAEHGRDDAECRKTVADGDKGMIGLELVVTDRLDLLVHQRFDFMGPRVAHDDQAEIIANEGRQLLVGRDARASA